MMKTSLRAFESLSEQEMLALAIASEEEDGRRYQDLALRLRVDYPATADMLDAMAVEESEHRQMLLELYKKRFGPHILWLRREEVAGFLPVVPVIHLPELRPEAVRKWINEVEGQNRRFYQLAAARAQDVDTRKLLGDLALAEGGHEMAALKLEQETMAGEGHALEVEQARKQWVLQVVQPGLAGLMDGSVSTLAPLFAAAMATQSPHATFVVGLAASVGAGISMGLTEGMSDDGVISGRGNPWIRGSICGLMTTVGGLGHTLPYLISHFETATYLALAVVVVELVAIAYVRYRYMQSGFWASVVQVVVGGTLVVLAGFLLGNG